MPLRRLGSADGKGICDVRRVCAPMLERRILMEKKKSNKLLWVLAIIGCVAAVAAIAYAVYRFLTPDYLEDFDEDFDDDFDDYFEDDDDEAVKAEDVKAAVEDAVEEVKAETAGAEA